MPASPLVLRRPVDAARLRTLRLAAGLTQETIAHRTGLALRTVTLAETRAIASPRTLAAIAGVLRVDAELLVADRPPPPPREAAP